MRGPTLALFCCLGLMGALTAADTAAADVFGPISLVSEGRLSGGSEFEQADYAADSTISASGRYVAFDGSVGGRTGVFRRDLRNGEIAIVAAGDALLPSISAEGRYVAFTTTERLDEENDTNSAPDVYVRDMEVPSSAPCGSEWEEAGESCPFALASAKSDSPRGLSYQYGSEPAQEEIRYGALASGRSAISADGREVAFITTATSDLDGGEVPTPKLQVAVRYLDSERTELVSTVYSDGQSSDVPVPLGPEGTGAVYPGGALTPEFGAHPFVGASISADGSTVAWMGQNIGEQAPVLTTDPALAAEYTEPLWRHIADAPQALTRRITGGSDPANQACASSGETQLAQPPVASDPCQGPFDATGGITGVPGLWTGGIGYDYVPQLSSDGMTVAFLATARWIAGGEEFSSGGFSDDLYRVDMHSGLTRVQSARRLTELAGGSLSDQARSAPIVDLGISPDGSEVAFTSERTVFPLGTPAYVSPPAAATAMIELFDIDFANETLARVTTGFEGQPSEVPVGVARLTASPSFSGDGNLLAFSSTSDDLAYGDGNKADDSFLVSRLNFTATATPQEISPAPANPPLIPAWSLGVTATSRRDGTVVLYVNVPAAGSLQASADGAVRVRSAHASRVVRRIVAIQASSSSQGGLVELRLKLRKRYSPLAGRRLGLNSTATVTFTAPGQKPLRRRVAVTFLRRRSVHHSSIANRGRAAR